MGSSLMAKAGRAVRAIGRGVRDLPARWRRSLQFRVVTVTMAVSLTVAAVLGFFIVQRVADGIVQTRLNASAEQATAGFNSAAQQFDGSSVTADTDLNELAGQTVRQLDQSSANGSLFQVMIEVDVSGSTASTSSLRLDKNTMPAQLVAAVEHGGGRQPVYQFAEVGAGGQYGKALVWGQQIPSPSAIPDADVYVYYVFSLAEDQQTLTLVEVALATAGFVLVFTLAGIAWFISRSVVIPVRAAAAIAERLASGRLEERMRERGEDDLASLASSFNKMAANLQSQIRRLEELSRVQRRFVSDVSHELRTPLTTVRMAADLIHEERDGFEPTVARSAELLQNQLDRFEELLADLLEISRFDAGAAVLEAEPVDLRLLVARVVESSAPLAERKGSRVVVQATRDPAVAEVDARRIDRVLRNLVVNAIEHGEGRDVVVTVAASEDAVAVAVRDHGVGLRPGESSLVFNRFWRADPARARTTGGTGLGLAIAFEDARLHHGWLQAWGEPGGGSQFRLTVPRSASVELTRSPISLEPEDSIHHLRQRRGAIPAPPPRGQIVRRPQSGPGMVDVRRSPAVLPEPPAASAAADAAEAGAASEQAAESNSGSNGESAAGPGDAPEPATGRRDPNETIGSGGGRPTGTGPGAATRGRILGEPGAPGSARREPGGQA
ncbi:MAG TPA: MtrAB system histidine kinase MtrB [Actinocrinis sp.]|jgi:two-component system sensor histidine kinase MtrB